MKKHLLVIALAGAAMTACTSEDVVAPGGSVSGEPVAIAFSVDKANMGRAANTASGLETVNYDFGVWAYKTDTQWSHTTAEDAAQGDNVVMDNYLVGYYSNDESDKKGYEPAKSQVLYGSNWYYEFLGSGDAGFTFHAGVQAAANTSANTNQFLKYWDLGKTYVNFYACSPYGAATSFKASERKMNFKPITENDAFDLMYGCASMTSAAGVAGAQVPIQFRRLSAQIRLAFYSELSGYDVELIDYQNDGDGIMCLAANYDGTTYTAATTTDGYVTGCTPVVTWGTEGNNSATISYTSPTIGTANLVCPLYFSTDKTYAAGWLAKPVLGEGYANRIYGGLRRVVPHGNFTNCGFTVNVSFKLTAKDTKEVVYVYGARVYVAPDYTQWEPNKLYTYVFKVTKNVPGTTAGPEAPDVKPTNPALHPIVFNNVTVEDLDYTEIEYPGGGTGFFN